MPCNKITKPEFTKEQIAECKKCKHASEKVKFCQLFGHIQEHGKIIVPDKKIKYPNMAKMGKDFVKEGLKYAKSGFKNRSKEEQKKCTAICKICDEYVEESKLGPRCRLCGCCERLATLWKTKHCKLGKW